MFLVLAAAILAIPLGLDRYMPVLEDGLARRGCMNRYDVVIRSIATEDERVSSQLAFRPSPPVWFHDGQSLLVLVQPEPPPSRPDVGGRSLYAFALSPDGQRFGN